MFFRHSLNVFALVCFVCSPTLSAQQPTLMEELLARAPGAPKGIAATPLPTQPLYYSTGEGVEIKVEALARGLSHPWGMAALPDGTLLVTERNKGQLRIVRNSTLDPRPAAGIPAIRVTSTAGLHDVVLHPNFSSNHSVYLTYNKPLPDDKSALAVLRGTWDGKDLTNVTDLFVAPGVSGTSRVLFDGHGHLFVSIYGGGNDAQDLNDLRGKVLRLTEDGKVPSDNPFINTPNARPEIYTYGHRTIQGLVLNTLTNDIWSLEMGPNGGDEVNILKPAANYGWPLVSLGRNYPGPWQSKEFQREGFENPVVYWMPSISVSGMTFYTGAQIPEWRGDLFVGGVRMGEVPGTGQLQRIRMNANGEEIRREALLSDLHYRIRGAHQGSDGALYVLTDEDDAAVLRISKSDRSQ
jgi:aldose sugar dehydrogenase